MKWDDYFIIVLIFIAQRLLELFLSRKNEVHLAGLGGKIIVESGFIPFIFGFFLSFLISCIWEYAHKPSGIIWIFFWLYLSTLVFKEWCIVSLGKFWNIRLWDLPESVPLSQRGPYRVLKHPVYLELVVELLLITLAGRTYLTLAIFLPILIIVLIFRVRREERSIQRRRNSP